MKVEEAPSVDLEGLVEVLADLRHDLGKYICFETRFVGVDAPEPALREALQADLRRTRCRRLPSGEEQTETAWALWERLRPAALGDDPDVAIIDALIGELKCSDLDGDLQILQETASRALRVSSVTRRLLDRGRAALARAEGGAHG